MFPTRTFGVELEAHLPTGKTQGQLAAMIRRMARVHAKCERYNHGTRDHWKLTTDGSLGSYTQSVEVVSPILSGEAGVLEAGRVVAAMQTFGCTISVRCGMHVHVFANDLTVDQLRVLATNFAHAETAFDAIMPPSRRRDLNTYILSNRTAFGGDYDKDSINRAIDAYAAATDKYTLIRTVVNAGQRHGTRYRKLNLESMGRYGTVEFRQHSGTIEPDKAMNWIRVCVAFVERSMNSKPRKRTSEKPHKAADQLGMLLKFLRAGPQVCKFYRERSRLFNERTIARVTLAGQAAPQA